MGQKEFRVNDSNNIKIVVGENSAMELTSELTPISLKEAQKIIGKSSQYATTESLARAILDFTAIARAYIRTVPKYQQITYNNR